MCISSRGVLYDITDPNVIPAYEIASKYLEICILFFSEGDKIYEDYNLSKKGSKDDSAAEVMIWEVIDWYKQAVVLTRESDIEVEAMAFSRLGRVYYHALDMESKARENFTKALQLSLSLFPRTFTSDGEHKYLSILLR